MFSNAKLLTAMLVTTVAVAMVAASLATAILEIGVVVLGDRRCLHTLRKILAPFILMAFTVSLP